MSRECSGRVSPPELLDDSGIFWPSAAIDLDADGRSEIVAGTGAGSQVRASGSLGFAPQRRLAFDDLGTLRNATIADADGDGTHALLVTVGERLYAVADPLGASTATALAESTYPVEVADVNADGVLDVVLLRPGSPLRVSVLVSDP